MELDQLYISCVYRFLLPSSAAAAAVVAADAVQCGTSANQRMVACIAQDKQH